MTRPLPCSIMILTTLLLRWCTLWPTRPARGVPVGGADVGIEYSPPGTRQAHRVGRVVVDPAVLGASVAEVGSSLVQRRKIYIL